MTVIEGVVLFVVGIILVAHIGIAWILLCMPGNLFDWFPVKVLQRIRNPYIYDLLSCAKCVSGQAALWSWVVACFYLPLPVPMMIVCGLVWICSVIVFTDQMVKRYGY